MATSVSLKELEDDPRLFLYTSLTAGSSHIITATSRMETILKANRIPFQAIDTATDTKARQLWQRRAGQRKLPGLVKEGFVIGDLNEVEEWNEFGELKENIGPVPANNTAPTGGQVGVNIAAQLPIKPKISAGASKGPTSPLNKPPEPKFDKTKAIPLPGAQEIAERNKRASPSALEAINPETLTSSPEDKKQSIEKAKEAAKSNSDAESPSAVASQTQSATAAAARPEESTSVPEPETLEEHKGSDVTETLEEHKGSDVTETHPDEVKKIGPETSVQADEEPIPPAAVDKQDKPRATTISFADTNTTDVTKGVESLQIADKEPEELPQEQQVKKGEDAGKSVED